MASTKKQKREQKLKKAKKALVSKMQAANRLTKSTVTNTLPKNTSHGIIEHMFGEQMKPNYQELVSKFNGTMEEWYEHILQTHNEYGFGFDYDEMEGTLLDLIEKEFPEVKRIFQNADLDSNGMVEVINSNFKHKLVEMLVVTHKQNEEYWSGDLERQGHLTYALVEAD